MLSLRRLTDTPRLRHLLRKRAASLANCWRKQHEWGFNPWFGQLQCVHCGKVSHDDLFEELTKLLDGLEKR